MLKATVPPIWKVGSFGPRATFELESGVCVQFKTAPLATEVRFSFRYSPVPMSLTASTPCNWAAPRLPSKPVNFFGVLRWVKFVPSVDCLEAVKTARSNVPFSTRKPTADGFVTAGNVTSP